MYGTAVGRLAVLSKEGTNGVPRIRWMTQRNQRNQWHQVQFEYNSIDDSKSVQFLFYGRVGSTSSSDIAIDDINISNGECQSTRTTTTRAPSTTSRATTTSRGTATPVTTTTPSTTVRPPPTLTNGRAIWSGMPRKYCNFHDIKMYDIEINSSLSLFKTYLLDYFLQND